MDFNYVNVLNFFFPHFARFIAYCQFFFFKFYYGKLEMSLNEI